MTYLKSISKLKFKQSTLNHKSSTSIDEVMLMIQPQEQENEFILKLKRVAIKIATICLFVAIYTNPIVYLLYKNKNF